MNYIIDYFRQKLTLSPVRQPIFTPELTTVLPVIFTPDMSSTREPTFTIDRIIDAGILIGIGDDNGTHCSMIKVDDKYYRLVDFLEASERSLTYRFVNNKLNEALELVVSKMNNAVMYELYTPRQNTPIMQGKIDKRLVKPILTESSENIDKIYSLFTR